MNKMPVIDMTATGRKIRDLRVAAGISVGDLQAALGFANPQSIYKWQRGDGMPSMKTPLRCGAVAPMEVVSFGGHKTLTYF